MRIVLKHMRDQWRALPRLIRFLLVNCAIGIAGGWTLLAAIIVTDTAHLRTLIWNEGSSRSAHYLAGGRLCRHFRRRGHGRGGHGHAARRRYRR